ncbi:MAG TPA: hypothetical protein VGN20_28225 [Mucilaginibacter sp.]|jgi:hypothetical protein
MKKILIALTSVVLLATACNQNPPQQNNVTIENNNAPAGFDVNKLAQLVKTSTNPQILEKGINDPNNHINNLDLDKDGNIDYVKVEESGPNKLKVVDDVSEADSVTIAHINIAPDATNSTADLSVTGNPQYVGTNNYYHSSFSFTDFLLLSYLMRPHAYYMPMYHYGYYPSYYTRTRTYTTFRPTTSSAMSSRTIGSRSSLSSPRSSQRSFGTRSPSTVRSGGFGHSNGSGFGHSSGSSRSGFGHSRGGFGRRR